MGDGARRDGDSDNTDDSCVRKNILPACIRIYKVLKAELWTREHNTHKISISCAYNQYKLLLNGRECTSRGRDVLLFFLIFRRSKQNASLRIELALMGKQERITQSAAARLQRRLNLPFPICQKRR